MNSHLTPFGVVNQRKQMKGIGKSEKGRSRAGGSLPPKSLRLPLAPVILEQSEGRGSPKMYYIFGGSRRIQSNGIILFFRQILRFANAPL